MSNRFQAAPAPHPAPLFRVRFSFRSETVVPMEDMIFQTIIAQDDAHTTLTTTGFRK